MGTLSEILHPPVAWRYYIVYWRLSDGRILYFRGQKRRSLFISNQDRDWTSVEEKARLFENRPDLSDQRLIHNKDWRLQNPDFVDNIHWRGFDGTVLKTHLIIPEKPKRRPPG